MARGFFIPQRGTEPASPVLDHQEVPYHTPMHVYPLWMNVYSDPLPTGRLFMTEL